MSPFFSVVYMVVATKWLILPITAPYLGFLTPIHHLY